MIKHFIKFSLILALALGLTACGGGGGGGGDHPAVAKHYTIRVTGNADAQAYCADASHGCQFTVQGDTNTVIKYNGGTSESNTFDSKTAPTFDTAQINKSADGSVTVSGNPESNKLIYDVVFTFTPTPTHYTIKVTGNLDAQTYCANASHGCQFTVHGDTNPVIKYNGGTSESNTFDSKTAPTFDTAKINTSADGSVTVSGNPESNNPLKYDVGFNFTPTKTTPGKVTVHGEGIKDPSS